MSLYISITIPNRGLSDSPIDQAITQLAEKIAIEKKQSRLPEGPALDITFMLSSEDDSPSFNGMMMGGYTLENKTLYFKTAVPKHITQSSDTPLYVSMVLQDVIKNANDYFQESGTAFNKELWRKTLVQF